MKERLCISNCLFNFELAIDDAKSFLHSNGQDDYDQGKDSLPAKVDGNKCTACPTTRRGATETEEAVPVVLSAQPTAAAETDDDRIVDNDTAPPAIKTSEDKDEPSLPLVWNKRNKSVTVFTALSIPGWTRRF